MSALKGLGGVRAGCSRPLFRRRRYSSPLRCGHKTAHLITESTNYRYLEDLSTPKKWFKANVDHILSIYGAEHRISKEELYLGALFGPIAISQLSP